MRYLRSLLLIAAAAVMMLATASCSTAVKEYDMSSLTDLLQDELGVPGDQITVSGNDISADYNGVIINASFFEDAGDAHDHFGDMFYDFALKFNNREMFDGEFISDSSSDSGYVVLRGEDSEAEIFGPEYRMGPVYAGLYYSGAMVVKIVPGDEGSFDDAKILIDTLGFPNV